jgi:NADPH2:quinone reductase
MKAIQITEFGGPEVLTLVDLPVPVPGDGEVLVHVTRAGLNFGDTHSTRNTYVRQAALPFIPGGEVAGVRADTGERVIALTATGGYAQAVVAAADRVSAIPEGVDDGAALALLIQGLTAWHMYKTSAQLRPGESVVIQSAGGGVGSLAVQLGHALGAGRVIAVGSNEQRRELALELGADVAIDAEPEGFSDRVIEANGGEPVDVIFEMTGGPTFDASLSALAPFGRLIVGGISTEQPNEVRTGHLLRHSRGVIGFLLWHCLGRPQMIRDALDDLFARAARGELRAVVGETYPLSEARRAHEDMLARRTRGKLLLDPSG